MSPITSRPVADAYCAQLNHSLETASEPTVKALAAVSWMKSARFRSIFTTIGEMDRLYAEMREVLDEFQGRKIFLTKILTLEHLAMAMKLYVISWSTMLDLLARLVNVDLDLGIADGDITVRIVFNNGHVRSTGMTDILEKYRETLAIKDLKARRNGVIHRGRMPDSQLEEMWKERNVIDSDRFPLLESKSISDDEYKLRIDNFQERLQLLAKKKQALFEKVHVQTIALTSEVARALAETTLLRVQRL